MAISVFIMTTNTTRIYMISITSAISQLRVSPRNWPLFRSPVAIYMAVTSEAYRLAYWAVVSAPSAPASHDLVKLAWKIRP